MSEISSLAELTDDHRIILAALYLRGLPRIAEPGRRSWPRVLAALRRSCATLKSAASALAADRFDLEALLIQDSALIGHAARLVEDDRVLTAVCDSYPTRWLERLGAAAPPAVWWNGVSFAGGPSVSIVGSRHVSATVSRRVADTAARCASSGRLIVSGGAIGCDRAAAQGAWRAIGPDGPFCGEVVTSPVVEILPFGLGHAARSQSAQLSVCAWDDRFSTAAAMERNALIYAWSSHSLVGHARVRAGGAWTGAADALRRRLSQIAVWDDPRNEAAPLLIGLGAFGVRRSAEFLAWIDSPSIQADVLYPIEDSARLWGVIGERPVLYAA